MSLSFCLIFCKFQSGVAYKSVAYKKSVYLTSNLFLWHVRKIYSPPLKVSQNSNFYNISEFNFFSKWWKDALVKSTIYHDKICHGIFNTSNMVPGKLPPRKIAPRLGSGFGFRLALELGLGGNFPRTFQYWTWNDYLHVTLICSSFEDLCKYFWITYYFYIALLPTSYLKVIGVSIYLIMSDICKFSEAFKAFVSMFI